MLVLLLGTTLLLPMICATTFNHTQHHQASTKAALAPEKIERIAQKLLRLTLNTSHVQISHCIMHPDMAQDKDRRIHFHINVISDVFIEMPIFVRKNITINLLKSVFEHAEPHDLSLDCWSTDERPDGFHEEDMEHMKPYAYGEHVIQDIMEEEFNKTFIPEFFYVENVCEHYGIDRAQESHFQILIVSEKFKGKDIPQRRFMVDELVNRIMMHGVARLFCKLFTPEEYKIELEMEKKHEEKPAR
ncbi:hypothetical protein M8J77_004149 [Diaphorina citri]|nr:hypothetical protein M8J77_004149 [Diaphorina citri]